MFPVKIVLALILAIPLHAAWDHPEKSKVAVYEFSVTGKGDVNPALLSDALAGALQKKNAFIVLERSLIKKIMHEKNLEMSGITENEASRIGVMIGADKIISGSISRVKDRWVMVIKGIDVKTGTLELFDQVYGYSMDDLLEAMPLAADRLVRLSRGEKQEPFSAGKKLLFDDEKEMPSKGLLLYLPLKGNAKDESLSKNHGSAVGTVMVSDRFDREKHACHFREMIAYISTGQKSGTGSSYTIALWFRTTSPNGGRLIGQGDRIEGMSGIRDKQLYLASSGRVYFGIMNAEKKPVTVNSFETFNDGEWHLVTALFDRGMIKLYVDAELKASGTSAIRPFQFEGYWRVGYDVLNGWPAEPRNYTLDSDIGEVRIYNRALTEAEIRKLFHRNGFKIK